MTTPERSAGEPPSARVRVATFLLRKPLAVRRAAGIIASVTVSTTIIAGVATIHFTDPKNFPDIGDGL
jgi:hypothetical protein